MLATLLCWRAMVLAAEVPHPRLRTAALHRTGVEPLARKFDRPTGERCEVGAPSAAKTGRTAEFLRRHLRR
jgi:hypothetical protein